MRELIERVANAGERFTATVAGRTDAELRGPSALPGWSRAHAVSHVARSIDAYLWLLALARTGAGPDADADADPGPGPGPGPRLGGEAIGRAVEKGARRPAAELVEDLRTRLALFAEACAVMPAPRWETLVPALAGWHHPAWYTLHRCVRELETHHVDLDLGYRTADWPADYVSWALDDTTAALAGRGFPLARLEATDLGRTWDLSADTDTDTDTTADADAPPAESVSGPGHALLAHLAGRPYPEGLLSSTGPLPTPPAWPLPPFPGWGRA